MDKIVMTEPVNHVIEADIRGCLDKVSHEWLMKFLQVRIKAPSLLLIIGRFLKAGNVENGMRTDPEEGTPQGGTLSPMLANVFLHNVLDLWFEKEIKPKAEGRCHRVRCADYVKHYPLPLPAIKHTLYTRSPVK